MNLNHATETPRTDRQTQKTRMNTNTKSAQQKNCLQRWSTGFDGFEEENTRPEQRELLLLREFIYLRKLCVPVKSWKLKSCQCRENRFFYDAGLACSLSSLLLRPRCCVGFSFFYLFGHQHCDISKFYITLLLHNLFL